MNVNNLFQEFDQVITLADSKTRKLRISREDLRKKIKKHEEDAGRVEPKFYGQGSFSTNTIVNPIIVEVDGEAKENYDIDDGVYFIGGAKLQPSAYHSRIFAAVKGHALSEVDKSTCVQVEFADGHHIDLPIYFMESKDDVPEYAHKTDGWMPSDPREFKKWVSGKCMTSSPEGQLRRVIRYLKAWTDFRESSRKDKAMPSGLIMTILAINNYESNTNDDESLVETVKSILASLQSSFVCLRPTTPEGEDLLDGYTHREYFIDCLIDLIDKGVEALNDEKEVSTSEKWQKMFGDRFPKGSERGKGSSTSKTKSSRVIVGAPWG